MTRVHSNQVFLDPSPRTYGGDDDHDDDNNDEDGDEPLEHRPILAEPQLRRSTRQTQPSSRYPSNDYVLLTNGGEPETYEEAMSQEKCKEWYKAMQDEMTSLHKCHEY